MVGNPEPNRESATAAVEALRRELDLVNALVDGIDQKAALIPPVLAGVAALFVAPDTKFTRLQAGILVFALVYGIAAVYQALRTFGETQTISLGGDPDQMVAGDHFALAAFNHAVAGSLAIAVKRMADLSLLKGRRLRLSVQLAGITLVLLAAERVAGGF